MSFLLTAYLAVIDAKLGFGGDAIGILGDKEWLIWLSLSISLLSSTFGMAKFLKNCPVKHLPSDGPLSGYATPGFVTTMFLIASFMTSKAVWITMLMPATERQFCNAYF